MRTRLILLAAIVTAPIACDKPDCEAFATHLAKVMTKGLEGSDLESGFDSSHDSAFSMCKDGEVTAAQIECVKAAIKPDVVQDCMLGDKK